MNFNEGKEKFYNRFGIENIVTEEKERKKFRIGLKNILMELDAKIEEDQIKRFCTWFGFEIQWKYTQVPNIKFGYNIANCIINEEEWVIYLHKIESLFLLSIPYDRLRKKDYKRELFVQVQEVFLSTTLPIQLVESNGEYFIFPSGSCLLDDEVIIKTLKFLDPRSHNHFILGLKSYSNKNRNDYIKAAENMRRTLEEYLRYFFKNDKGLEQNIKIVGQSLKMINKPNELKTIFHKFLEYMDKLFNEHSKHNDGNIGEAECEYIILKTGLILKYLDKIKFEIDINGSHVKLPNSD